MSEIEKVQRYIDKHKVPYNPRYEMPVREVVALAHDLTSLDAVMLAFTYGRAKGYRAAKAEAGKV